MEISRDPRFTGMLLFAGLWNLALATWALFFTGLFIQVFALEGRSSGLEVGQKVFWASVGIAGILFIVSGFNNARCRFIVAIAVPGKILACIGSVNMFLTEQAGVAIIFVGLGDLLFTIPFIMYLRATRQLGWV